MFPGEIQPICRVGRTAVHPIIVIMLLLVATYTLQAQRGGGGAGGPGLGGGLNGGGAGRPGGVSEKDELKDFHRAMAEQATPEQRAAYAKIAQLTQAAIDQSQAFRGSLQKSASAADGATTLDQNVERARASMRNFLTSFTDEQKSSLKDFTIKLEKSDAEVEREIKALGQLALSSQTGPNAIENSATSLQRALTNFQTEQIALASEMGILQGLDNQSSIINLPTVTNATNVAGLAITIPTSGALSKTSGAAGKNNFNLRMVSDLTDVQQNILAVLRPLNRDPRCGERIQVQDATLAPAVPAGIVLLHLHFERWMCAGGPTELASGDGEVEVRLTPIIDKSGAFQLNSEISRVQADRFLRDMLASGDLGSDLREQISTALLGVMQKSIDRKTTLPPAAQSAVITSAQFQNPGVDQLSLVIQGSLEFTDEQASQFATQLKQPLSAQAPIAH